MSFRSKSSNSLMNTHSHLYPRESLDYYFSLERKSTTCKQLKDMALYCIIRNFSKIMDQYYANEEENSRKRQFEYLKRFYSKMLFEILSYIEVGPMKERFIYFLINSDIKSLDLSLCPLDNTSPFVEALEIVGHTMISLNLSGRALRTHKVMELISLLPNLETIHIDFIKSKNTLLGCIRENCPNIKTISMSHCQWMTDRSLHFLCTLNERDELEPNPNIVSLDLIGTRVTEDGIALALRYFPSLKHLRNRYVAKALHTLHCEDLHIGILGDMPKYFLKEIYIYSDVDISEVIKICSVLCRRLTRFSVNKISSLVEMKLCLNFHNLKELQLIFDRERNFTCPDKFLDFQKDTLKKLHIEGVTFSVAALSQCRKLHDLNLTYPLFQNFDKSLIPSLNTFSYLTKLEINEMDLSDSNVLNCVLYIISSSPNLSKLTLQSVSTFPDDAMDSILKCDCMRTLHELDVSFSEINVSSIDKALQHIPELQRLVIESCGIPLSDYCRMLQVFYSTVEMIWR